MDANPDVSHLVKLHLSSASCRLSVLHSMLYSQVYPLVLCGAMSLPGTYIKILQPSQVLPTLPL